MRWYQWMLLGIGMAGLVVSVFMAWLVKVAAAIVEAFGE